MCETVRGLQCVLLNYAGDMLVLDRSTVAMFATVCVQCRNTEFRLFTRLNDRNSDGKEIGIPKESKFRQETRQNVRSPAVGIQYTELRDLSNVFPTRYQ